MDEQEIESAKEFVNVAAHQLQEPLAAAKWVIEGLLAGRSGILQPKQQEAVTKLWQINEEAARLMSDLLTVARLEGGRLKLQLTPTDLTVLVRKIMKRHDADIKEYHGSMYFTGPKESLPVVPVDITLFSQAIDNLISNAIKYNPIGTHITVAMATRDQAVVIAVKNRGPAIPEAKQSTLFQKYVRAGTQGTEKTKGTGLGLYITKQIVELHGGEVSFESAKDVGTTFFITLPVRRE
jgi:two-component system phosphate regulon sensor histidine kinase PhoR